MQKWIILIVVAIIVIIGIFIALNVSIETEYVPETEIEEVELRKTIVTLYFKDKTSGDLTKETRLIDSKLLLREPYAELVKLLLTGPENTNNEKLIPEGVTLIDCKIEGNCVIVNFSKELKDCNLDDNAKMNLKQSILNTLTELTEVNDVRILVEGEDYISNN